MQPRLVLLLGVGLATAASWGCGQSGNDDPGVAAGVASGGSRGNAASGGTPGSGGAAATAGGGTSGTNSGGGSGAGAGPLGSGGASGGAVGDAAASGGSSGSAGGSVGTGDGDAAPASSDASPPAGDPGTVTAGMTKLFDGTTLTGWDGNPAMWSVKEGAIDGMATQGGQLIMSKDDYDEFRLIVKSRLPSKTQHLGICIWGGRMPVWKYNGCLLVIPPNAGSWDYQKGGGLKGTKFPAPAVDPSVWHESEILASMKTGTITMATNGVKVFEYKEANLARLKKGPIGLQIHAGASEVQYKDIYVEVNPTDPKLRTVK